MSKTLCELKRYLKHDIDAYIPLVCRPRFVCTQCGRAANKKKNLCRPQKMDEALLNHPEPGAEVHWAVT